MTISTARFGSIFEIVLENPPVNALSFAARSGILAALEAVRDDASVAAVVIRGSGRGFSAGADIAEFDGDPLEPLLPAVVEAVENFPKPVIATLHGQALGGGLELALACHYRVAAPSARLGLPEVQLGLLPGAGGTQRLPRLVGVADALNMIVTGRPITATKALAIGLVDQLSSEETLIADAFAFAAGPCVPRKSSAEPIGAAGTIFETFATENKRLIVGLDAPKACIEAVRAANDLPFEQGLLVEKRLFEELLAGKQSQGLRHAFFAERMAGKLTGLAEDTLTLTRKVLHVAIIGAGTMGAGIAMNFLSAGIPVTILDRDADALNGGLAMIRDSFAASAAKGRIAVEDVERLMGLITGTLDFADLSECDLFLEAVFEDFAVKVDTLQKVDAVAREGAIIASNTSFLDLDVLAKTMRRPQDVVGLHFFSPANIMKLLEVVRGAQTANDVLATAMTLARTIGKVAVVSGVCHGFIGNRILLARQDQAEKLLLEGADPHQIDQVHLAIGMPMGPFQMTDLAGMDISWHRDPSRIENIRDVFCAAGRFGQKSGAGFYDYDNQRKSSSSELAQRLIEDFRASSGITPRTVGVEEIRARTLYVMVNEAAGVLEEGIAQRASDIDVVWLHGYGWPRHTGGLINWANQTGLATIVEALDRYTGAFGMDFHISTLLRDCARRGVPLERV